MLKLLTLEHTRGNSSRFDATDLVLEPPVAGYGMLQFKQMHAMERVAHEHAVKVLRAWLNDPESSAPTWLRAHVGSGDQNELGTPKHRDQHVRSDGTKAKAA